MQNAGFFVVFTLSMKQILEVFKEVLKKNQIEYGSWKAKI